MSPYDPKPTLTPIEIPQCMRWAAETKSERHRQVLLEMAKTWTQAALEIG
jgi:hypothetical protein